MSGLIGAGAAEGLDDVILRMLSERKFQEQMRAQKTQESQNAQRIEQDSQDMAQRASEHTDMMGIRTRGLDLDDRDRRDRSNRAGVEDMMHQRGAMDAADDRQAGDAALDDVGGDPLRRIVALSRAGVKGLSPDDLSSPEQRATTAANAETAALDGYEKRKRIDAKYREPRATRPTGAGGLSSGQLSTAKQFQDDYSRDSKTYITIRNGYQQVRGAAENPDAAGDLSLIFGYMKMLDPYSVVRETEFANAQNAAGVPDRVRNLWNKAMTGERLAPNQRQQFMGQAQRLFQTAHENQAKVRNTYSGRATKFEIDPSMVLDDEDPKDDAPSSGLAVGTERVINGKPATWDGKGWLAK